jgi:hypothetical protein
MRVSVLAAVVAAGVAATAAAQGQPRFQVGPVARVDRISLEGGAGGATFSAGLTAGVRLGRFLGVEAEITRASRRIERSYEGWFISYATNPNATREEIERMAPTARRTLGYAPGLGWSGAFVVWGQASPRVRLGARAGFSARRYNQTSSYVMLTIPDGIDPARIARDFASEAHSRTRGGLLVGADAEIDLTKNVSLVPDVRLVYGGPARVGNKYREFGLGLRAGWSF